MVDDPLLSVVICAYNAELCIANSLTSVLEQTYSKIEIIVVDDGSTDRTPSIIQEFAEIDDRIVVVTHEKNRGLARGRKSGSFMARGEYILFLDADDAYHKTLCEVVSHELGKQRVDILHFPTEVLNKGDHTPETMTMVNRYIMPHAGSLSGEQLIESCFLVRQFTWTIWNKAYRREVLCRAMVHLDEQYIYVAEDVCILFLTLFYARSYRGIEGAGLYCYSYGSGISGNKTMTEGMFRRHNEQAEVLRLIRTFLDEVGAYEANKKAYEAMSDSLSRSIVDAFFMLGGASKRAVLPELLSKWEPAHIVPFLETVAARGCNDSTDSLAQAHFPLRKDRTIRTIATYYYRLYDGGTEAVIVQLARIWKELGYDVVVITDEDPDPRDNVLPEGVRRRTIRAYQPHKYHQRAQDIATILREENIDLFVNHAWTSASLLWDSIMVKALGIPVISYVHSMTFSMQCIYDKNFYQDLPRYYQVFDAVLTLSRVDQVFWRQYNSNTFLTINPAASPEPSNRNESIEAFDLLWVGRLEENKGYRFLVPLVKEIKRSTPEVKLTIVGSYDKDCDIIEEIERENLAENISLVGFMENVDQYYYQAKIQVMTSFMEGFPLTLYESKAAGLPCVAFDLPTVEMFRDRQGGLISVPAHDIKEMAKQVNSLLSDAAARHKLAADALNSITRYAEFDHKEQWAQLIERLVVSGSLTGFVTHADEVFGDKTAEDSEETLRLLITQQHYYAGYASRRLQESYHAEREQFSTFQGRLRRWALASDSAFIQGLLKLRRIILGTQRKRP